MGILGAACLSPWLALAETATYRLTVTNDWSQANHKAWAQPFDTVEEPHFSHLGGATHNAGVSFWELGEFSSPGVVRMQETGFIDRADTEADLRGEIEQHIAAGTAGSFLYYPIPRPWFPAGADTVVEFDITDTHPLVTLVSMLGPSPDWFIGVSGLNLRNATDTGWLESVAVDLYPHDGGTRSRDEEFALFGPREDPPLPIRLITDTDDTALLGSVRMGRFTFELLTPAPILGDYNGSGQVEQGDLDLVLQNWGVDTELPGVVLAGWVNDLPTGQIEQTELDRVLQNWGNTSSSSVGPTAVPEPGSAMMLIPLAMLCRRGLTSSAA